MRSAWGIEHGEVSKSFKKLDPKLNHAEDASWRRLPNGKTQTLDGRFRENYAQWRSRAGRRGQNRLQHGLPGKPSSTAIWNSREDKKGAAAMVTGIGNMSRRAGRFLP